MRPVKLLKLSMTLLFVLLICSACTYNKEERTGKSISSDELRSLSEKDVPLGWSDFNKFSFEDTGSGIYIRNYPIEGGHRLVITGKSLESPPEKMYMVTQNGTELDFTQVSLNELYGLE